MVIHRNARAARRWITDEHHRSILIGTVVVVVAVVTTGVLALGAWRAKTSAECLNRTTHDIVTTFAARDQVIDNARAADIAVKAAGRDTLTRILELFPANGRTPTAAQIQATRTEIQRYIPQLDQYITSLETARAAARALPLSTPSCVP